MTQVEKLKEKVLAVKKPLTIEELIKKSTAELKDALPADFRPERMARIALTTLRLNPALYNCDPMSFIAALFQASQLGLTPNMNGESWFIPYNIKGRKVVQFQIGVYGWLKLFWQHESSMSIQVEVVKKEDLFNYDLGECTVNHQPPPFDKDRGETIGYYAFAKLKNGGKVLKVISKKEAFEHAKRFSKCYVASEGKFRYGTPWAEHFDEMAKVVVLKKLLKLLPKSTEVKRALEFDETVKTKIDADMINIPNQDDFAPEPAKLEADAPKPPEIDSKPVGDAQAPGEAPSDLFDKEKKGGKK